MNDKYDSLNISYISKINPQSFCEGLKNLIFNSTETSKLFCFICKKTPLLEMKSLTNIKITCNCTKEKYKEIFEINEVIKKFILDLDDLDDNTYKNYEKYFKCEIHNNNIYKFFCNKCNTNLCDECYKIHKCSKEKDITDFNVIHYQICKNCIFLDNAFNEDDPFNLQDSYNNEINISVDNKSEYLFNLKRLISTLIYEYNTSPNMEIIRDINNIYNRLSKNYYLYIKNKDMNINIEIFINLEILNLKGNNLSDISPLATVKFNNLKTLNLNSNQIGDDMIKYIYKFDFPKLENLDLGINNLKNYEFFKSLEHFHELKQLNITSNLFNKKLPENWKINEIKLLSLEKIDFSNGIFSEESINLIFPILKFKFLKNINLMSNNIRKLDFIRNLKNCPLEILNLNNNEIDEKQLIHLYDFSELKEIHLKNNLIQNIDEVNKLVNKLENLDKIIISGNKIDLYINKEQEEDIIDEINEIFENLFY